MKQRTGGVIPNARAFSSARRDLLCTCCRVEGDPSTQETKRVSFTPPNLILKVRPNALTASNHQTAFHRFLFGFVGNAFGVPICHFAVAVVERRYILDEDQRFRISGQTIAVLH